MRMASNDARLAASLRSEWPTLEAALRDAGWQAQREAHGAADTVAGGWRPVQGHTGARWAVEGGTGARTAEPATAGDSRQGPPSDSQPRQDRQGEQGGMREELLDLTAIRRLGRRRQE